MDIIDEQGRLFGLVNVIDALVVLLVVAVVVAGIALVLQEPQPEPDTEPPADTETVYATISFGDQPVDIAETIATSDQVQLTNNETGNSKTSINVTDIYRAPGPNGNAFVVARVAMTGRVRDGSFAVGGKPVRTGDAVTVVGDPYTMKGRITALSDSGDRLPTNETPVVIQTTVPTAVTSSIHEGDTYRIGAVTGATVESVTVFPTNDLDRRRVQLGVQLRTLSTEAGPQFAGQPLYVGQNLTLALGDARVTGTIVARGTTSPPGEQTDVTVEVAWHNVRPVVADAVPVGTTERLRGITTARVVEKITTPETVIVRDDNGTLHARDHPRLLNVTLTVDLAARRTDDGLLFHGRRLQVGRTVVFDFGTVTVQGQVVAIASES